MSDDGHKTNGAEAKRELLPPSKAQTIVLYDAHATVESGAKRKERDLLPLPGLLAIGLYLVLLAGVLVLGVVQRHYPAVFLLLSAAFLTAAAGLVMLFRWAWAGALAAVFLLACYNGWIFAAQHMMPALVQAGLNLVFFLYLVRAEVREKLR